MKKSYKSKKKNSHNKKKLKYSRKKGGTQVLKDAAAKALKGSFKGDTYKTLTIELDRNDQDEKLSIKTITILSDKIVGGFDSHIENYTLTSKGIIGEGSFSIVYNLDETHKDKCIKIAKYNYGDHISLFFELINLICLYETDKNFNFIPKRYVLGFFNEEEDINCLDLKKQIYKGCNLGNALDANILKCRRFEVEEKITNGKELFKVIQNENTKYNFEDKIILFLQMLVGLYELHSRGIIHCDIKPENIMVCEENDGIKIKYIDFGGATLLKNEYIKYIENGETILLPEYENCIEKEHDYIAKKGTTLTQAPEIIKEELKTPNSDNYYKRDIWALGIVIYEFLYGIPPFDSDVGNITELQKEIINNSEYTLNSLFSKKEKDFFDQVIKNMLNKDPSKRSDIINVIKNVFDFATKYKMKLPYDYDKDAFIKDLTDGSFSHEPNKDALKLNYQGSEQAEIPVGIRNKKEYQGLIQKKKEALREKNEELKKSTKKYILVAIKKQQFNPLSLFNIKLKDDIVAESNLIPQMSLYKDIFSTSNDQETFFSDFNDDEKTKFKDGYRNHKKLNNTFVKSLKKLNINIINDKINGGIFANDKYILKLNKLEKAWGNVRTALLARNYDLSKCNLEYEEYVELIRQIDTYIFKNEEVKELFLPFKHLGYLEINYLNYKLLPSEDLKDGLIFMIMDKHIPISYIEEKGKHKISFNDLINIFENLQKLHEKNISLNDFKIDNIVKDKTENKFYFIDYDETINFKNCDENLCLKKKKIKDRFGRGQESECEKFVNYEMKIPLNIFFSDLSEKIEKLEPDYQGAIMMFYYFIVAKQGHTFFTEEYKKMGWRDKAQYNLHEILTDYLYEDKSNDIFEKNPELTELFDKLKKDEKDTTSIYNNFFGVFLPLVKKKKIFGSLNSSSEAGGGARKNFKKKSRKSKKTKKKYKKSKH